MGRWFGRDYGWYPRYRSVREKRQSSAKALEKLKDSGVTLDPVVLTGKAIASSFWGKSWCDHLENFSDFSNRMPRGRTYVRSGAVCHLQIEKGRVTSRVQGSDIYKIDIKIKPLKEDKWAAIKQVAKGKIGSLLDLLQGKISAEIMQLVSNPEQGLFPLNGEMKFECSCPDYATMCKHVAATLYGVGARLDRSPELLFLLRGVNQEELIVADAHALTAQAGASSGRRVLKGTLDELFGVELVEQDRVTEAPVLTSPAKTTQLKKNSLSNEDKGKNGSGSGTKKGRMSVSVKEKLPEGSELKALRLALGYTQTQFATQLKITAAQISAWERGKSVSLSAVDEKRVLKKIGDFRRWV